jgi:subtilisin family serine protease
VCEINAGHLILCFSRHDPAAWNLLTMIRERAVEHVSYRESMTEKLSRAHLTPDPELNFELHLVEVPVGQENWKSHYLQFFYKHEVIKVLPEIAKDRQATHAFNWSSHHFIAAPNHVLTLAAGSPAGVISAKTFAFGPLYGKYKEFVGLPAASAGVSARVRVVVIDSGIAGDAAQRMRFPIVSQHNILDASLPDRATDEHGHGTAVTLLIDDLSTNVEFFVIKVAGKDGRIAEWDALAALVARTGGHVVNLSMQFGLLPREPCKVCGRRADSAASRSAVFENLVEQVWNRPEEPVLVAAAGNSASPELAYPSRLGNVVAIGAVTSTRQLSTDSNYGDVDAGGSPHALHFVMPGGEGDPAKPEEVLSSAHGRRWFGTSFATAFATAVVSTKLSQQGVGRYQRPLLLQSLSAGADSAIPNFSTTKFGHGIMRM